MTLLLLCLTHPAEAAFTAQKYAKETKTPELTGRLLEAAGKDDFETLQGLIAAGVDLDAADREMNTALIAAAAAGHMQIVRALIAAGATANLRTPHRGETALAAAAGNGQEIVVAELLANDPDDESKLAAFRSALASGFVEIVKSLVGAGVDPKAPCDGTSHIALAVMNKRLEIVRLLISYSADVNNPPDDQTGYSALELAANSDSIEMTEEIINAGADSRSKARALCAAASLGNIAITNLLLDAGADVDAKGSYGKTALEHATENGHKDVVQLLEAARVNHSK
jgi:ankyrin repeat protein